MAPTNRFQDENLILSDFYEEVLVVCPTCSEKALATVNFELKSARLFCVKCGFNKETSLAINESAILKMAAHHYFDAKLWLTLPFKNEVFWALNEKHLIYLENYISAKIREHKDRKHFTLLEKLPKFYHDSKNREGLLKLITKLKSKL